MSKTIKIIVGVMVFLGVISLIFLLVAKRKTQAVAQTSQPAVSQSSQKTTSDKKVTQPVATSQADVQAKKAFVEKQWQQCKSKTMTASTNLFCNVQISEGIPTGGTYAKGTLDNDPAFPVRVIIKSDSKFVDNIKKLLVSGKNAALRGNCTDVATDGAVVLQVF